MARVHNRRGSVRLRSLARHLHRGIAVTMGATVLGLAGTMAAVVPAAAVWDEPAPKIDCRKKENRTKPACKQANAAPATTVAKDEIFFAAYGLARSGQYAAALAVLKLADQSDPRVLNYLGFATRKLGDVDAALPYYQRALAIDPDYVLARAYLGEAYLQKGEPGHALGQLAEIERRCGRSCVEYVDLAMQIRERGHRIGG